MTGLGGMDRRVRYVQRMKSAGFVRVTAYVPASVAPLILELAAMTRDERDLFSLVDVRAELIALLDRMKEHEAGK